ncbi:MAG TPA: hypothetical protein VE981_15965 [Planctomycetota bacterium]|nr:hypothetical protein [Planctomycetota bacterium]
MFVLAAALLLLLLQDAPPAEVACVELTSFEVRNSEINQGLVAEGAMLNRTPFNLTAVSVDVVIIGDNKFPLKTLQRQVIGALPARKGASIFIKDAQLPGATRFTFKVVLRHTVEGQERTVEYENYTMKNPRLYYDPEPGPKVGVMGLRSVAGSYKSANKQQVYSGDTLFLRLRIDGFDDKVKPEGQLEVTFSFDGKKQASLKRSIDASAMKTDISKLPANDADPKMVFYDGRIKELVVGLRKVEDESKLGKAGMDVKFSSKGSVWTWTGLEAPHLEALRPPDRK